MTNWEGLTINLRIFLGTHTNIYLYLSAGLSYLSPSSHSLNVSTFLGPFVVLIEMSPDFSKYSILVIFALSLYFPTWISCPTSRLIARFLNCVIGVLLPVSLERDIFFSVIVFIIGPAVRF